MTTCNHDITLWDAALAGLSTQGSPYQTTFLLTCFLTVLVFFVSTITGNYSQVDKLWSIVPVLYAWIPVCDERTLAMAIVVTIWGVRLTYNFGRRGGYAWPPWDGDEDYRWAVLRSGKLLSVLTRPVPWMLFNLGFISFYQNLLLFLMVTPSLVAYSVATNCGPAPRLGPTDFVAMALVLFFVGLESEADNQQLSFQTEKHRRRREGAGLEGEYADGFTQKGLFAVVRKPNYAAEQAVWISYYLFSVAATEKHFWNWSAVGWIAIVLLFQGSGWFTETISREKYPKYEEYRSRVPLYVPNIWYGLKVALGKAKES